MIVLIKKSNDVVSLKLQSKPYKTDFLSAIERFLESLSSSARSS